MTDLDLTFEFDPDADPDEAAARVLDALRALPVAGSADARPQRPMAVDPAQTLVTIIAVFAVLRGTVGQLDVLTRELTTLVTSLKQLRRVIVSDGDETREVIAGHDDEAGR